MTTQNLGIGLIDFDSKIPNLALMKLSTYLWGLVVRYLRFEPCWRWGQMLCLRKNKRRPQESAIKKGDLIMNTPHNMPNNDHEPQTHSTPGSLAEMVEIMDQPGFLIIQRN